MQGFCGFALGGREKHGFLRVEWPEGSLLAAAELTDLSRAPDNGLTPIRLPVPIAIRRRGVETRMVLGNGAASASQTDTALIQLVARAHTYLSRLTDGSGRNLTQIALDCRTELSEVSRILPLAFLAPAITEAIMAGRQPASLTAQRLLRLSDLPIRWDNQVSLIG